MSLAMCSSERSSFAIGITKDFVERRRASQETDMTDHGSHRIEDPFQYSPKIFSLIF
jgi:hypothetical protein